QERSAGAIAQDCAAVLDRKAIDRERIRIDSGCRARPFELARRIEGERDLGFHQAELRRPPLATHERSECQLDRDFTYLELRLLTGTAGFNVAQDHGRCRKDARVDLAIYAHRQ